MCRLGVIFNDLKVSRWGYLYVYVFVFVFVCELCFLVWSIVCCVLRLVFLLMLELKVRLRYVRGNLCMCVLVFVLVCELRFVLLMLVLELLLEV